MEVMRLVVTGPVGAGKSTFIRAISEIEPVDTDRIATDETRLLKQKTTVAFDFGRLQFSPNMSLHLYGTPGQSRFDFMWDILIDKADAYVVLIPANRPSAFRSARQIIYFMAQRVNVPMVIGLTHTDCPGAWFRENMALVLGYPKGKKRPKIIEVNANKAGSVAQAVIVVVKEFMKID